MSHSVHPSSAPPRWRAIAWTVAIVVALWTAYANSLSGPFVFDDSTAIVENSSLRRGASALSPPTDRGTPVTGRPLVNLTLALNYRASGLDVRSYHLTNLGLHVLVALALFGLVRRTLAATKTPPIAGGDALSVAGMVALLWGMHPLTTAAVTYLSQRSELLVALCYTSVLYFFCRSLGSSRSGWWQAVAVLVCWLGMASKEVMVSAPLLVLLYDRAFGAGTIWGALRTRPLFYGGLAGSWALLGWIMLHTGDRVGTAGFGLGISPWSYFLSQWAALVHYLRLAVWPAPLVFDYGGKQLVPNLGSVWPQGVVLASLAVLTGWALWRNRAAGFVGALCFAVLAPTSSFVPIADTLFEHRFYLPLAGVLALAVVSAARWLGRYAVPIGVLAAAAMGMTTAERNRDYRSEIALWTDTVAKRPDNVRARYTLGTALAAAGRDEDALRQFEAALTLDPGSAPALNGFANLLARRGEYGAAGRAYRTALQHEPSAEAHNNLANVLLRTGEREKAREHYEAAIRLRPTLADAHNNLGNLCAQSGELAAAIEHYSAALQLRPDLADAHANLANVLAQSSRGDEAIAHYMTALQLRPRFADAHFNLATTHMRRREWKSAIRHYEAAVAIDPNYPGGKDALQQAQDAEAMFGR